MYKLEDITTAAVVGTGTMGRGIAQILAQAGVQVRLFDTNAGAAQAAVAAIDKALARVVERGKMTAEAQAATIANLHVATDLGDLSDCQLVVEAIIEQLDAKIGLFQALEGLVAEQAILATNTSSLSVAAIANGCRRPERVAGWHFFNPVPLMKLVEVVEAVQTDPAVTQLLIDLGRKVGHTPIRTLDSPGFLVNHAGRGLAPEGMRILSEGVAGMADIDRIVRDAAGLRMGPFELMDLLGTDTAMLVMESIYEKFYQEQRFRITPILRQYAEAGQLGRKSGAGFYKYTDGAPLLPAEATVPSVPVPPLWISDAEPDLAAALRASLTTEGRQVETGAQPSADAVAVVTPLGQDVTTAIVAQGLPADRTMGVDMLFPIDKRRTLMCSPATSAEARDGAHAALAAGGVPVTVVRDSPGFVAQRIAAMIINIGCDIAQQRIASPADIDVAARLGLGYPKGPLAWGDSLGAERVLHILDGLFEATRDPRYRASLWLRRRAALGLSLLQDD
jgi:3-hydroxybutyryl-CoA dehydrogenase